MSDDKPFADEEFIKNFYKVGFTNGYNYTEATYIAKYFYWILKYGKNKTKNHLREYCEKHDPKFNYVNFIKEINDILNRIMKKKPNKNKDITVTQKELSIIETVKNYKDQKLLFSFLVMSKRIKFDDTYIKKRKDYIGYRIHTNIAFHTMKTLGYNFSFSKCMSYLQKFCDISFLDPIDGYEYIKILFANDNSIPIIEVLGNENPWDKYNEYNGGECIICLNCGRKIIKISNNHKYCNECKKIKKLESGRKRFKKFYNKSNVFNT